MKIMQVITLAELGGAQSVVLELCNAFINMGHEVLLVSNTSDGIWDLLDNRVIQKRVPYFKRNVSPIDDFRSILEIKRIYKDWKPDIIHLHSSKAGVWGRLGLLSCSKKIIYTVHGFDTILKANKVFLILEKVLARRARYIVPVSEYDLRNLNRIGIVNTVLIENGITFDASIEIRNKVVEESRLVGKKNIMCIARLMPPKRVDLYEQVAKRFNTNSYSFFWVGADNDSSNTYPSIIFLGNIKNAKYLLSSVDLFVLLSDYEGLPMSIIEALAASCPVVASDVGGISSIIHWENGSVVCNNVDDIEASIHRILDDDDLHKTMSLNARETFEKKYMASIMVKKYEGLYRRCQL